MLDNKIISPEGVGYNIKNEIVQFELPQMIINSTESVTWKIKSVLNPESVGAAVYCKAQYQVEGQTQQLFTIETPKTLLHEIKITSDTDLVVVTPETESVVTFTVLAPSPPTSRNFLIPTVWNYEISKFREFSKAKILICAFRQLKF